MTECMCSNSVLWGPFCAFCVNVLTGEEKITFIVNIVGVFCHKLTGGDFVSAFAESDRRSDC
jgi:hypothetical protein